MKNLFKSLGKSISEAFSKNEYFIHWRKKYPNFFNFVEKRLSLANPYGFYFSIGIILSAVAFFYFFALTQDILAKDPFVEADIRFMNLVAALRSVAAAKILLLFTYLGNWQFIISLGVITAIAMVLLKEKRKLIFLIIGVAGGELLYTVFKLLLHRTRPDIGFSLIPRNGYAFPSGHATMSLIFYGMIGYGFLKKFKKRWLKPPLVILAIVLIFLVGFSRIYLGAHWVSDVLAGWAFGAAFLILLITFFKQQERFKPETKVKSILSKKSILFVIVFLLIFEGISFHYFYTKHPLVESKHYQLETVIVSPQSNFQAVISADNFPKFSETIVGEKMEPISFIVVGSGEQIVQIFQKSGLVDS
ncbi:MAG: phosphatase PAP2 family protein [Candidatus Portnoybacteria bacterium]|nr:phosphatase PAP2 family protein [Candidatus Portnoybacteria bacterium]